MIIVKIIYTSHVLTSPISRIGFIDIKHKDIEYHCYNYNMFILKNNKYIYI